MTLKLTALLLALGALLAVACDDSGGGDSGGATGTPSVDVAGTPLPEASVTICADLPTIEPGTYPDETMTTSDGREREYILFVPSSYDGQNGLPLVLNFHGFALTDDIFSDYTQLNAAAEDAGFIVVTPQGLRDTPESAPRWNLGPGSENAPDDVAFAGELLDELGKRLCVDRARVYSAGYSNGAALSSILACEMSDRIAAIAPVAGLGYPEDCAAQRPMPVIAFHGTEDVLVPFNGRPGGGLFVVRDVDDEVLPDWAEHNGCTSVVEEAAAPGIRLIRHEGCDDDATVELYAVEDAHPEMPGDQGGGHTWPGASGDDPNNATTQAISANELMLEFFAAHRLP